MDSKGEYWRSYVYITDASSYDQVEKPEDFYESAVAFGHFQRMLADYPAETLNETIKGFHDTRARFQVFKDTVAKDVADVQQKYRMRSTLYWHMKTWQMYLGSFRTKENFRFVSRTMIQS